MPILVTCPCGQQFHTREENAGRAARCTDCGRELTVPAAKREERLGVDALRPVTSGRAVASLVLGLASFACFPLTSIPALVAGVLAMREINRSRGTLKGRGYALAGMTLGVLGSIASLALLIPAFDSARESARQSECTNNLKTIALALHNYQFQRGYFPPAATADKQGHALLSWRVAILPYLGTEAADLYAEFHLNEPWDSPHNRGLLVRMPAVFACPSHRATHRGNPVTSYQAVVGPRGVFRGPKPVKLDEITDGTSNTLMVVEGKTPVPWTAPDDLAVGSGLPLDGAGSAHPGGFLAALADGSVRFIEIKINPATFNAVLTRDGGEIINGAW